MRIERRYTKAGQSPFSDIEFRKAKSEIRNPDGSVVFLLDNIDVPSSWSQVASDVIAQKYFRKAGVPAILKKVEENDVPSFLWRSVADEAATAVVVQDSMRHAVVVGSAIADGQSGTGAGPFLPSQLVWVPWADAATSPRDLTAPEVQRTIVHFVTCEALAKDAGYDGVEIMASEGYLINEFIAARTNHRTDDWGGSYENRMRLPVAIVKGVRERVGPDFIVIYRLSMLDLIEDGSTADEVVQLAQAIEAAGASIINTGIGWHEARIPTIATSVPRAAFAWVTRELKGKVGIPLVTTNRINAPQVAEDLLAQGYADMVSMARPFLADPEFLVKAAAGTPEAINTCIACNQACLDHTFSGLITSCLVNPRACHETVLTIPTAMQPRTVVSVSPFDRCARALVRFLILSYNCSLDSFHPNIARY